MYYVKHRSSVSHIKRKRMTFAVIMLTLTAVFILFNLQMRRIIEDSTQVYTQNVFSSAVSESLCKVLEEYKLDSVNVRTGSDGRIVSIEANTAQINRIQSEVTIILLKKLNSVSDRPIEVTLGTLTGIEALAGLGPKIEMRLELRGGVSTEITSSLSETGINQSLHTIDCIVAADYYVILPGCRFMTRLTTTVPLAQSVIVGDVPDAYTYVVGDQSDTVSRIFDYAHLEP